MRTVPDRLFDSSLRKGETTRMKMAAFIAVILSGSVALAADRQWKDAKVTRIASGTENNGVVVGATGTTTVGGVVKSNTMYYWIETEDMITFSTTPITRQLRRLCPANTAEVARPSHTEWNH